MNAPDAAPHHADYAAAYRRHRQELVALATAMLDDDTGEDAVQTVFTRLLGKHPDRRGPMRQFLRCCVANECLTVLRRRDVRRGHADAEAGYSPAAAAASAAVSAEEHAIANLRDETLRAVLATVCPRFREVLILRFWHGLPVKDVARHLGISVGAVKNTQHRAVHRMSVRLAGLL